MPCSATLEQLAGRRIGLLGFGRDGRACAAALCDRHPDVDLTVLVESGEAATDWPVIAGPFDERLQGFEVLIRSPGVPVDHPALVAAREHGVRVVNPASIWLAERGAEMTVVGVTGSKGKSTTAALLAHLLHARGRDVLLAGNIGVPLLDHLDTDAEVAVIELSSYQLSDLAGRLDLGVFTRLFPEHIDWHGSEAEYVASKLRLAELLDGRPLLVNAGDERLMAATAGVRGRVAANRPPGVWRDGDRLMYGDAPLCPRNQLPLIGRHNLDNAALALQAAIALGHDAGALAGDLASFRALPHRLEPVATVDRVRFINDSISTSPFATLAALEALRPAPVVLIAGGQQRPGDWHPVVEWIAAHQLDALIALPDSGRELAARVGHAASNAGAVECIDELETAVARAFELARPGGVVLLSPGAPSFNRFRDFEARGACFRAAVGRLAGLLSG